MKSATLNTAYWSLAGITIGIGAWASSLRGTQYWLELLEKPAFFPSRWLSMGIWSLVYVLTGIAFSLMLIRRDANPRLANYATVLFFIQLGLTAALMIIFYQMQRLNLAFGNTLALALLLIAAVFTTYKVNKPASLLMLPYLGWTLFAVYVNYQFLTLNPIL